MAGVENAFLFNDHTNLNEYIPDKYVCIDFAIDLIAAAHEADIDAWLITITFENSRFGHALVGFMTTDKGEVRIEPQNDSAYSTVISGELLCFASDNCFQSGKVIEVYEPERSCYFIHNNRGIEFIFLP